MKLLTGNDLASGDVIWWTGNGWSRHVGDAVDVADNGDALLASESAARRVNAAYIIDADATAAGPLPTHIKERIRASGPTVRTDLAINPEIEIVKA
ncbi:MAG: DUF2849 domain-containing protein [Sphingobium sp.]